ncbi:hypothetical protein [Clostridium guangxiense]|uniref:hypothetical protein n=1 Tax=Clostridium guangxiense TaxID=1662055 RepID=UPI001E3170E9|nr:hypothetical protein [Clostridium guangxiense]MCD2345085.1 hypothetical protein [Clostridium guangxiense]
MNNKEMNNFEMKSIVLKLISSGVRMVIKDIDQEYRSMARLLNGKVTGDTIIFN